MLRLIVALAIIILRPAEAGAQAENIAKGVDVLAKSAGNIADQGGILGNIAMLAIGAAVIIIGMQGWAIVSLYKALQTLQNRRADDAIAATKEVASTSISGTEAITKSGERLADHSARLQTLAERTLALPDAIARIESELKDRSEGLAAEFEKLAGKVELSMRRGAS